MPKVKLLYVITKLELGGAQKHLLSLIRSLDQDKYSIYLFTSSNGLLLNDFSSVKGLVIRKSAFLERSINPFKDILALFEIYSFIKKNKIEVVHTHSSKAGILGRVAAKLARARFIIHTIHGWSFNDYQSILARAFYIYLERIIACFIDKLIVVSDFDRQKGLLNNIGSMDKYALVYYGIDYAEFSGKREDFRKELGLNSSDLVVGTVSCLKPQKSPRDFIKLASLVKQSPDFSKKIKFILVGDGVLRGEMEKLITDAGLQEDVILVGWRRDIPKFLSEIDVFVLVSLWEGFPIAVLEAMASSLPVMVTDTGGVREAVIDGETGFIIPRGNMELMAEKLILLLKDEGLRKQMGGKAKESLSERFLFSNMVKNTQSLYNNLISSK